jgi:hypothetical protein
MANIVDLSNNKDFTEKLRKAIQSAHLNFLIGAGCSVPALNILGNIENEIESAIESFELKKEAQLKYNFLENILKVTQELLKGRLSNNVSTSRVNYIDFLKMIKKILFERKNNILHKQATIFSTNYDLFVESAIEECDDSLILNDGFRRTAQINQRYVFSSSEFFNAIYNTGNLYNYQYELPTINLIKLHGSMNWGIENSAIIQSSKHLDAAEKLQNSTVASDINKFNSCFNIVLPQKEKFGVTLINQTYYDLFRIYANELDKENVLLIAEGFSFADEHIFEITKRALKNPSLQLVVFCFNINDKSNMMEKFSMYQNVDICFDSTGDFDFKAFSCFLANTINVPKQIKESDEHDEPDF